MPSPCNCLLHTQKKSQECISSLPSKKHPVGSPGLCITSNFDRQRTICVMNPCSRCAYQLLPEVLLIQSQYAMGCSSEKEFSNLTVRKRHVVNVQHRQGKNKKLRSKKLSLSLFSNLQLKYFGEQGQYTSLPNCSLYKRKKIISLAGLWWSKDIEMN